MLTRYAAISPLRFGCSKYLMAITVLQILKQSRCFLLMISTWSTENFNEGVVHDIMEIVAEQRGRYRRSRQLGIREII